MALYTLKKSFVDVSLGLMSTYALHVCRPCSSSSSSSSICGGMPTTTTMTMMTSWDSGAARIL